MATRLSSLLSLEERSPGVLGLRVELFGLLKAASRHVGSPAEGRVLRALEEQLTLYFDRADRDGRAAGPSLHQASAKLSELVDINGGQARASRLEAASWDRSGNWIGLAAILAMLAEEPS